jgi:serine/threonine-protein kinase RsbW
MDKIKDMPTRFNNNAVEIVLDNKLGYERVAMACAASFAKMMGFSDERIEDLKTMVAEAAINAIQHGNKDRPDAKVSMSMNLKDGALQIAVADNGGGIKDLPPKPDISRIIEKLDPPTGFGTFLIKQLADEVEFNEMTDGGHMVKMTMRMQT